MEQASEKMYFKIKDVSEMLDIPQTTLRFWEKEFPECAPRRSKTNIRYYSRSNIEKLRMIKYLIKDQGLRIEAAKERLRTSSDNVSRRVEVINRLEKVRTELQGMLEALVRRR